MEIERVATQRDRARAQAQALQQALAGQNTAAGDDGTEQQSSLTRLALEVADAKQARVVAERQAAELKAELQRRAQQAPTPAVAITQVRVRCSLRCIGARGMTCTTVGDPRSGMCAVAGWRRRAGCREARVGARDAQHRSTAAAGGACGGAGGREGGAAAGTHIRQVRALCGTRRWRFIAARGVTARLPRHRRGVRRSRPRQRRHAQPQRVRTAASLLSCGRWRRAAHVESPHVRVWCGCVCGRYRAWARQKAAILAKANEDRAALLRENNRLRAMLDPHVRALRPCVHAPLHECAGHPLHHHPHAVVRRRA